MKAADVPKPIRYLASTGNAVLTVAGGLSAESLPRNVRNNNPLNIEDNGDDWLGLASPRNDGRFLRFAHPIFGYRAAARILRRYHERGIRTLQQVVSTWAPPSDSNNVPRYIAFITRETGIRATDNVFRDGPTVIRLLKAMAIMEGAVGFDFHPILENVYIARGVEISGPPYAA